MWEPAEGRRKMSVSWADQQGQELCTYVPPLIDDCISGAVRRQCKSRKHVNRHRKRRGCDQWRVSQELIEELTLKHGPFSIRVNGCDVESRGSPAVSFLEQRLQDDDMVWMFPPLSEVEHIWLILDQKQLVRRSEVLSLYLAGRMLSGGHWWRAWSCYISSAVERRS